MDSNTPKKLPSSTPDVLNLLGFGQKADVSDHSHATHPLADLPVANLPVAGSSHSEHSTSHQEPESLQEKQTHQKPALKVLKMALPYLAIFVIGIFLYYFFFTGVNFNGMFKNTPKAASAPQETALQKLESQSLVSYGAWINGFYFAVSDPKILDTETDNSGNGLSNFQKYLLNLNPKAYDTLGLGMADSQALSMGINPSTGGPLTAEQKDIVDKYIDMEVVMNRLTLNKMNSQGQVAGASAASNTVVNQNISYTGNIATNNNYNSNTANQNGGQVGLITPPGLANGGQVQTSAVEIKAPVYDHSADVNTSIPGLLEIPQLKISVPIIWSQDTNSFDKDLQSGVVHYPGTAMPGQVGTTYIAGHSSNYIWAKGKYNQVFSTLGNLPNNSSFQITVKTNSGKTVVYHYVVVKSQQYSPTDQAQFANTGKSLVALSTCWPVGSTAKRLVLFGELTQVEQ